MTDEVFGIQEIENQKIEIPEGFFIKIPKVEEPIPPKMEEIREDFNIFNFIKEIFLMRGK